ncbi:glycosyltransferase family 1 protein [Rhodonellum sp.]|uniref:glycosyltransferase family 4 protein n=1 Tax=Rhodonellum sp. TaxID=2231180 RepID=UPI002726B549|nr:glycosyltransferase family 1 protein [Rhodonellum sp.]MDO9553528.1 glycosyltransferase family 1 protein [Rhodonellum sp.]
MRIGIEAQRIFRKKKHGMDIVAVQMIKELQKIDRVNEYFIFVNPDVDTATISESENFKIIPLKKSPYPIWEQKHLSEAVKTYRLDLLHCTGNTAPINTSVPLVLTLHDIIYLEKTDVRSGSWYQRLGNLYRKWNVPKVVRNSDAIFTVSEFEKKVIDKYFKFEKEKVKVIYNGVAHHFQPHSITAITDKIKDYGLPKKYLLFLGNTAPKKNLKGVLLALKKLDQKGKLNMDIVMPDFGENELNALLASIDAKSIRNKIHLTGYIPNQDLPYVYSGAEMFLYPSLRESFGLPILEAMACGCPVITSNTSSMPEIAGDAAVLVDPFNPEAICEAIENLLQDQVLRSSLISKGYARVPLFSFEQGAKTILDTYSKIHDMHK